MDNVDSIEYNSILLHSIYNVAYIIVIVLYKYICFKYQKSYCNKS